MAHDQWTAETRAEGDAVGLQKLQAAHATAERGLEAARTLHEANLRELEASWTEKLKASTSKLKSVLTPDPDTDPNPRPRPPNSSLSSRH